MNRKQTILLVLVVALIASASWSIINYPRPKTVSRLKYSPGSRTVANKKRKVTIQPIEKRVDSDALRLDLLEGNLPTFKGYRRNIFQPIFVDKETMAARKAAAAAAKAAAAAAAEARRARRLQAMMKPPPIPSRMQRELGGFKFQGFVLKGGRKTIFLGKGDEVLVLKQGDTFAGRYVATSITDQVLIIKATDTGEELIIPVNESR
jgi:hypothetical protein